MWGTHVGAFPTDSQPPKKKIFPIPQCEKIDFRQQGNHEAKCRMLHFWKKNYSLGLGI